MAIWGLIGFCLYFVIGKSGFGFISEASKYTSKFAEKQQELENLSNEKYDRIIDACIKTLEEWKSGKGAVSTHENDLHNDIPITLKFLNPEKVAISEDYVLINFGHFIDSWIDIRIKRNIRR